MFIKKILISFFLIITITQTITPAQAQNQSLVPYLLSEGDLFNSILSIYTSIENGDYNALTNAIEQCLSLSNLSLSLDKLINENFKTPLQRATELYNFAYNRRRPNQAQIYRNIIEILLYYGASPDYAPHGKTPYEINDQIFNETGNIEDMLENIEEIEESTDSEEEL